MEKPCEGPPLGLLSNGGQVWAGNFLLIPSVCVCVLHLVCTRNFICL